MLQTRTGPSKRPIVRGRHEQRLREAFRADIEAQKRRSAVTSTAPSASVSEPGSAESKETIRIWRQGQRVREERHGGPRDGYYGVADGPLWWFWSESLGAMSNQYDPGITSGIGQQLQVMLDPASLLGSLRFRVAGNSQAAGRETVTVHAISRIKGDPPHGTSLRDLRALGAGADHYRIEVDRQRGVLLATTAIRNSEPFYTITTLAISFDEPIPAEIFQFTPPEGERIHYPGPVRNLVEHVTPAEAQRHVLFAVMVPDRVPTEWTLRCKFLDGTQWASLLSSVRLPPAFPSRPPFPFRSVVVLHYRSGDGRQSVSITQMAAAEATGCYGSVLRVDPLRVNS